MNLFEVKINVVWIYGLIFFWDCLVVMRWFLLEDCLELFIVGVEVFDYFEGNWIFKIYLLIIVCDDFFNLSISYCIDLFSVFMIL